MLRKLSGFQAALYLTSAIALLEIVVWGRLASFSIDAANKILIRVAIAIAICLGLWLHSRVARYLGATWFLLSGITIFGQALQLSGKPLFTAASMLVLVVGTLSLVAAALLFLSKNLTSEISQRRQTEPQYMYALRWCLFIALVVPIIIVAANDMYNLKLI